MKKFVFAVLVLAIALFVSCGDVHNPNGPEPVKTYSLDIKYIRTNVAYPDSLFSIPIGELGVPNSQQAATQIGLDDRVDNYTFKGGTPGQISTGIYGLAALDFSRGRCEDDGACKVGDRFIITVKETGFTMEITSIVPYTLPTALKTGKARMCKFQLFDNGTVDNAN